MSIVGNREILGALGLVRAKPEIDFYEVIPRSAACKMTVELGINCSRRAIYFRKPKDNAIDGETVSGLLFC
ncbi:predicted protein [Sclerotinia sclerotiorum 1980 UF-70]|uniref:Uncharacterized protein n=1 Tax=Sclerotinia sclerotiorum (strain ATCC 18683 / 1980 / Ss-1) TaxID=665079 RepID=A7EF70_SCLS1|nr:predicted protein [Sclerotinia sclerotiorum 1980 UF-70]EDO01486.1 predicted protein [Sclerotinia sclerotiorum 1980 UF-70]